METVNKLLIVDDDASICEQLADILEDFKYRPVTFPSAIEALKHLNEFHEPALMLMDVQMPGMSGIEAVRSMREMPHRPAVILMTGHGTLQMAIECLRLGAEDYITKPLDLDLLVLTLERVRERVLMRAKNEELNDLLIANSLLYQRRHETLKKLSDILRCQTLPQDFPQTAHDILKLTHDVFDSSISSIALRAGDKPIVYHIGDKQATPDRREHIHRLMGQVAELGKPFLNGRAPGTNLVDPNFKNAIFAPIRNGDEIFGAVQVSRDNDAELFADGDVQMLDLLCAEISILHSNARLYENYEKMTIGAITSLANALKHKDDRTGLHAERAQGYLRTILDKLGISKREKDLISFGMRLHDIGKIRVPNRILNKPGPLDENEWEIMRMHPVWGYDILNSEGMLSEVATLVRHHHERYDGTGYPDRIKGDRIPFGARVMTVIDSFDAMCSDRCYRMAQTTEYATREIRAKMGTQFDPEIGEMFLQIIPEVAASAIA